MPSKSGRKAYFRKEIKSRKSPNFRVQKLTFLMGIYVLYSLWAYMYCMHSTVLV